MNALNGLLNSFRVFLHEHGKGASQKSSQGKGASSRVDELAGETLSSMENKDNGVNFPHLYSVIKDETGKFNRFAISPTLLDNGRMEWRDTSRGGSIEALDIQLDGVPLAESAEKHPQEIQIITPSGQTVVLKYLTNEYYDLRLRKFTEGQPKFKDTDEIQNFYLRNF